MDGLALFEKALAEEKAQRDQETAKSADGRRRHHKHHHRHHRQHRDEPSREHSNTSKKQNDNDAQYQSSESRHSRHRKYPRHEEDESVRDARSVDGRTTDAPPEKQTVPAQAPLVRDSWMTSPAGIEVDYMHAKKQEPAPLAKSTPKHTISERELNSGALEQLNNGVAVDRLSLPAQQQATYTFGDSGSQWRMTKLDGIYTAARESGRSVEDVVLERYGSLDEFDEACEEKEELQKRKLYGEGYEKKERPTGSLRTEQPAKSAMVSTDHGASAIDQHSLRSLPSSDDPSTPLLDQTSLNRLRARLMKAKLMKLPGLAALQAEYDQALERHQARAAQDAATDRTLVLDASHSRMLAGPRKEVKAVETGRGRKTGHVEANEDMSVDDMVREERRTRGAIGGEGLRLAERIAKDAKFDDDLEYLDENAEKLATRVHKSDTALKAGAIQDFTKMNKILESCPLCHHEDRRPPLDQPVAPVVSLATRVFLTLPTEPELPGAEGGAVIVPVEHHSNLLECDDDEWEEIRNFMKSLTRLYHDQGREVLFYENAAAPHRRLHAALVAVPIPYELGDTAPAFFREAMISTDEQWSQHKKVIDTGKKARDGSGKLAFRRSIAKEMPYFHVWFTLDGGLGHVVENAHLWPKGDLFAREIIGGMLDADPSMIKRQGRWARDDSRLEPFKKRWRKFDWTRVLITQ